MSERERVVKFIAENGASLLHHTFAVLTATDGLPLIRVNGGKITSDFVREIEGSTP